MMNNNQTKKGITINRYYYQINDDELQEICSNDVQNVEKLLLGWNQLTSVGMRHIGMKNWPRLTNLYLWSNKIGSVGCKYLSKAGLQQLSILSLNKNSITSIGMLHLSKADWQRLKHLEMQHTNLGDQSLRYLTKLNSRVQVLNTSHNQIAIPEAIYAIELNEVFQLRTFYLHQNLCDGQSAAILKQLINKTSQKAFALIV